MILKIPFYENNGNGKQCMQVAMQSVLKYFLNKEFSLEELDRLTRRKDEYWTYTPQIASVLYDLGLNIKYYSKSDLEPFLEGESYFWKHYGKDAEKILKFTDLPSVIKSIEEILKYNIFEKRTLPLSKIENHIKEGHIPIVLIDHNKIVGKDDLYQGHCVVVTGFDEKHIYFHESGPAFPEPNKKVEKETFKEAMNANGTDNDCIIVFGKRTN